MHGSHNSKNWNYSELNSHSAFKWLRVITWNDQARLCLKNNCRTSMKKYKSTLGVCKGSSQIVKALALNKIIRKTHFPTLYMTTSEQTAEITGAWRQENFVQLKPIRTWKHDSDMFDYADYPNPLACATRNKVYISLARCCQKNVLKTQYESSHFRMV